VSFFNYMRVCICICAYAHTHLIMHMRHSAENATLPKSTKSKKTHIPPYKFKFNPSLYLNLYCEIPRNRAYESLH